MAVHRGKRVSTSHAVMLAAYERARGHAVSINQGQRTLAEQARFYRAYRQGRGPLAARPTPNAPHIKYKRQHHALDINAPQPARDVAAFYRSHGVPVAFNVRGEPWHMDVLDEGKLRIAAHKLKRTIDPTLRYGSKGRSVIKLKRLLYAKGMRNFSGAKSSNRYNRFYGKYTVETVKRFQERRGLVADGIAGPSTWAALRAPATPKPAVKPASTEPTKAVTQVSVKGILFVAAFEGGQSKDGLFRPYKDPVGVWTIGYGETQGIGPNTKPWTKEKALAQLQVRINRVYLAPVLRYCRLAGFEPRQHEADALASFAYNLGRGVFRAGTIMGDAIKSKDRGRIGRAFLPYDKAGSPLRPLPGLTRRRKAESRLFQTGSYSTS